MNVIEPKNAPHRSGSGATAGVQESTPPQPSPTSSRRLASGEMGEGAVTRGQGPADPLTFYGVPLASRLLLGTAQYPSPQVLADAVKAARAAVVTVSLRRESARGRAGERFFALVQGLGARVMPNTAGCRTAREAVTTARMARELFATDWVKLEVIANDDTLQPDLFGLVEAAGELARDGFKVFPYTTEDLGAAERLLAAGCEVLMPWGAPIGTGRGLNNRYALKTMRAYFPGVPLVIDAGIGAPSQAAEAMELGYDAVLLNTAVAKARDPVCMAAAFAAAVEAGRMAYAAGLMEVRDMAEPSTPVAGTPFFDLGHRS
jgi:thiazole synthase